MKTPQYFIIIYMIILCWFVLLCYSSHVVETGYGEHSSIKCIDRERKALLRFKQGIKSDDGGRLSSWGVTEDCCYWHGIGCSNRTGHVIMLNLPAYANGYMSYLEGKLDPSLFELTHLKYLDLSKNGFFQTIPSSIDSLTELEYLNLSSAGFFGEIPPQLGNLSKLASLDLRFYYDPLSLDGIAVNNLTAKSLRWMSGLTLLRELHLSEGSNLSEATDWVQTINNLPSLRKLYLDECQLPATFSSSSLSYINSSSSLRVVSLSSNDFNDSSIFKWLFNLSRKGNQLEYLDLSGNSLSGPVPSSFGKYMHSLSYLDLSFNQFEGSIPITFSNLRALRKLSIFGNKLNGPLLNAFQALSCGCANKPLLEHLDLSWNQFWGSVPNLINTFSSIKELHLSDNHLNGTISQSIGQLSMLEILDVSNNSLKATLNHNHFFNLSRLRILDLSDNSAPVLNINQNWIPSFQLNIIGLRSCKLGPSFPKWLLTQTNLSYLDISNAQISGELPPAFWTKSFLFNLNYLNISHNMIHGVLPNLSTSYDSLNFIDLSSNYFEGSIPSFVGEKNVRSVRLNDNMFSDATQLLCPKIASSLEELDLSNNLLSGKLPNCLMKMQSLQYLHLENNKFSGNIPTSIGDLIDLLYLHLQNNNFSGEFPESMLNCINLIFLDVGYNSLTGYIPPSIGYDFKDLAFLSLRGNNFIGKLPLSLCQLSNLHMLDIAMNRISGTIPNCLYNFKAMMNVSQELQLGYIPVQVGQYDHLVELFKEAAIIEWKREEQRFGEKLLGLVNYIDMSNNELEGEIPDVISNLTKLLSLDLSRNKLSGRIPSNIGQLTSLELLDLSNNQLSGVIPASLADVSFLGTLDLSNNNLSGRIPFGTQLQGFDPSSYMGNPLLCGEPLQKCAGDESPTGGNISHQEEHGHDNFYLGLCISVVLGFIVGFWGVCGSLVVKRSWRHAFFSFFGDIKDKIYVIVAVKLARLWRKP